jgi:putative transposase
MGLTEVRYYPRRTEYGGLNSGQVKRMKELEIQSARLRRTVSDLTLGRMILTEAAAGTAK